MNTFEKAPMPEKSDATNSSVVRPEALDADLYEKFERLNFDDYEYLGGDKEKREETKRLFLNGEVENPTFDYPKLETFDFEEREQQFLALKEEALHHENPIVAQVYRWRINESLAQLRMLKATKEGNDRRFSRYSHFVYGKPSDSVFEVYDKATVSKKVDEALRSDDAERGLAGRALQNMIDLSPNDGHDQAYQAPFPEKTADDTERLTPEDVRTMFEEAIRDLHLDEWQVVVDESGTRKNFSVSQETKTAHIPNAEQLAKRSTTRSAIQALIAHEIGTHAQRRERGERSALRILGLGLDRYLKGEEGVATYEQQKIQGAEDFAGFKNHFACALASGVDGVKRDFRALFEIAKQYHMATLKGVHGEKREEKADNLSWDLCVRTFRGTTCKTPGAIFTKDIVYREGNIGIYELLNTNKEEEHRFMVGKYDPTNERHVWILDQLGITESDLESLEQE